MLRRSFVMCATTHRIVMPSFRSSAEKGEGRSTGRQRGKRTAAAPRTAEEQSEDGNTSTSSRAFFESTSLALDTTNKNFIKRREILNQYKEGVDKRAEDLWHDKKFHVKKQGKLIEEHGGNVEAAVREHLQPTRPSFRSDLRQRPLDRKILEEIYRDLHGKRTERKLRRGVHWENWLSKGDGTAPVFSATQSAQQTFGFGGTVELFRRASHRDLFPQNDLNCPEVAFIGRTNSGKSSLINAIFNTPTCAYGHLPGSTNSVNFYRIGSGKKLTIVDCPGYGHYHAAVASAVVAENANQALNDYLFSCSKLQQNTKAAKQHQKQQRDERDTAEKEEEEQDESVDATKEGTKGQSTLQTPRNIKRVFVCVSSQGIQQQDLHYISFLNKHQIPFSVVIMKTDTQPVRFLARVADYIRCQLIHYPHCQELLMVSALRLAGVSKMQTLLANFAAGRGGTSKHAVDDEHPLALDKEGRLDLSNIV